MALIQDTGVTLKRLDFSESSQVLVIFTREHGKVRAIAKGIKRSTKTRFATAIDLLEVGDMVFSVRQPRQETLAIITEWKQRQALAGLREKLARLYAGQYAAEVTAALTVDWDPHSGLFDGLLVVLQELCESEVVLEAIVAYQGLLLREIGSWPELEVCVACRRPPSAEGDLWFSSFEGGLLCRDCEPGFAEKRLVDRRAVDWIRGHGTRDDSAGGGSNMATREPPPVARGKPCHPAPPVARGKPCHPGVAEAAFAVLNYHIAHLMGREPLLASKLVPARKGSP